MPTSRRAVCVLVTAWQLACGASSDPTDSANSDTSGDDGNQDAEATDASEDTRGDEDTGSGDDEDGTSTPVCPDARPNWCPTGCVDFQSDDDHCGSCGLSCGRDERCMAGACALDCPEGTENPLVCGGTCVDVDQDAEHCGRCNHACERHCLKGTCVDRYWREPGVISDEAASGWDIDLAVDDAGNGLAAWSRRVGDHDDLVVARYSQADHGWGEPLLLESDGSLDERIADIETWPGGDAVLLQVQLDVRVDPIAPGVRLYDAKNDSWSERFDLANEGTQRLWGYDLATSANGDAMVAWTADEDYRRRLRVRRFEGESGAWAPAVELATEDEWEFRGSTLVMDAAGNAVIVWTEQIDRIWSLYTRRFDWASQTWSELQPLEQDERGDAYNVALGADAAGHVIAAWIQEQGSENALFTSRYDVGAAEWSRPERMKFAERELVGAFDVAVGADGNAMLAWETYRGREPIVWIATYAMAEDTWTPAIELDASGDGRLGPIFELSAMMDDHGAAMIAWYQADFYESEFGSPWASYYDVKSGDWTQPELIEHSDAEWVSGWGVEMTAEGDAIAVWIHDSLSGDASVWGNQFR